jgi:18S rRNA (guanine1575-N7)-methyltransferase
MRRFFETLYACLTRGARAVLQIYPENPLQAEMLTSTAMKAGFTGGLVVDFPHSTRAKKYFLVLMVGLSTYVPRAQGEDGAESEEEQTEVQVAARQTRHKRRKGNSGGVVGSARHPQAKGKQWIAHKKEQMRKRGYINVPGDSKYTGRKRKDHF